MIIKESNQKYLLMKPMEIIKFFEYHYEIKINNPKIKLENILKTTSFDYMKNMEAKNDFGGVHHGIGFLNSVV